MKHREGSLETVVSSARKRNLFVSFGVLLLLTASMGLIIFSTQRAQRTVQQQMNFVAGVSHELRTPLSVICSAGENLADGVIVGKEQVARYGSMVRDEGRRLTRMVEQILEFAGIQSHWKIFDLQEWSVHLLVEKALQELQTQIEESRIDVDLDLQQDLPLVLVDQAAMVNCLKNLIANAIKYRGETHWLGIKTQLDSGHLRPEVQIQVQDKGRGISQDELPLIFEPFYRGREVTAVQINGNGLGLNLVKEMIAAHNGRVTVNSVPGKGSIFTLHIPAVS